ncbi:MAG: hypothetical protein GXO77_06100 [Calditrichaeota bacterium]|nr:hypothetical protein [Calditrichota bacterium]
MRNILIVSVLFISLFFSNSHADRRHFVWTYQYMTLPAGATELEFYQTTKISGKDSWEYRIEVEQGLTDRWDFSVYQIFSQNEDEPFRWDAVKFRTRYRFGETGKYILDPLLYLEYDRKLDFSDPNKLEAKLILGKQIDAVNLALNPVYEYHFAPGKSHELGFDMGVSYEFSPKFIAGVETTSRMEFEDEETEIGSYVGPTVSFATGNWWYTIGAAFGVTKHSDNVRVRFLMGIGL